MANQKLAELFVDLTLRGAEDIRKQVAAAGVALQGNAKLYKQVARDKIAAMTELFSKQRQLASVDEKMYGTSAFKQMLAGQSATSRKMRLNEEYRSFLETSAEKGRGLATFGALAKSFFTGNTEVGRFGGGAMGAAATVAGAAGRVSIISTAVAGAIYAGVRMAAGASDNAASLLSGSWKMVTNELGQVFLPLLVEVCRALQSFAEIIRNIKDSQFGQGAAASAGYIGTGVHSLSIGVGNLLRDSPLGRMLAGTGGSRNLLASANTQAGFSSIEDAWRRIQSQAASGGSLEAQLLQQNIEANISLAQIVTNTAPVNQPQVGNV